MAFISELAFRGGGGANSGEFVEVVLGPNDDPADFVVSVYDENGNLFSNAGIAGGEVTLDTLTGVPDPDNANFTIYTIPVGIRNAASDTNEGSAIALTDTSTNTVIDFFSADNLSPVTAQNGAASGATSDNILEHTDIESSESYKWDIYGNLTFGPISSDDAVLCLTGDALVRTKAGEIPCSQLRVGDAVWTLDHGYQTLRWIGRSHVTPAQMRNDKAMRPIVIAAGAAGGGLPVADLSLSRQHRVLIRSKVATRMFAQEEVIVPANKLTAFAKITETAPDQAIGYYHLLFDNHEVIGANGLLVESLLMAPLSTRAVADDQFQSLAREAMPAHMTLLANTPVRPIVDGQRAKTLVSRLVKNDKALVAQVTQEIAG